jgi:replication factor C subunit 3/5
MFFFIDKYANLSSDIITQQKILTKILDSFNNHNMIYNNLETILKKPKNEFIKVINDLDRGVLKYSNFQHLIIYGSLNSNKENLVNIILENIYGKNNIELKDVEYIINGYGNTKTKVNIKQSKYHIVIEPNSNGFDKYLIQEIIQNYAKTELLNILKYKKLFKIVVINKLDSLSYYAQASLRRTMEKYSDSCKFIFISDQLSKIIEPIRSRCILLRAKLPSQEQILDILLKISIKENIKLKSYEYNEIINKSEFKISTAIWLLELKKYKLSYDKNWDNLSEKIVSIILNRKNYNNQKCLSAIKNIREIFYTLFITNIPTQIIIRNILIKLLEHISDLLLKINVIEIASIFELRLSQGTRNIIHFEAFCIRIIYLFDTYFNNKQYRYNLDILEI